MNEMIQEAVLNSIDTIDDSVLYAEYNVLMSMFDVYAKSALIQEESGLVFDGESIIQEATDESDSSDDSGDKKTGVGSKIKGGFKKYVVGSTEAGSESGLIGMIVKFIRWIKGALRNIGEKLSKLVKRKKTTITGYDMIGILEDGGEIEFNSEDVAAIYELPVNPTVEDIKRAMKKYRPAGRTQYTGKKNTGSDDSAPTETKTQSTVLMIPMKDLTVKFNLGVHIRAFKKGLEFFEKSIEEWNAAVTNNNEAGFKSHFNAAEKNRADALKWWSDALGHQTRGKSLIELTDIEMELSGISNKLRIMQKGLDDCEKSVKAAEGLKFDTRSLLISFIKKETNTLATGLQCVITLNNEINGIKTSEARKNPDTGFKGPKPDMPSI